MSPAYIQCSVPHEPNTFLARHPNPTCALYNTILASLTNPCHSSLRKVAIMNWMFTNAVKFTGSGLEKWNTDSLTAMGAAFQAASEMNADLGNWSVSKVKTMSRTFNNAGKFAGAGLSRWITSALTTLYCTFNGAGEMDEDLGNWDVSKVNH